jgi:hypothetical protein
MPSFGTVPILLTTIASFLLPVGLGAKTKKVKPAQKDPQDQIKVVGHIPVPGDPITSFVVTQHYSQYYLYAEHQGGKDVTLIDITNTAHPVVLSDVKYPSGEGSASLFAVSGTAALITEGQSSSQAVPASQTIRIMDLSDPQHPAVAREFLGVTAISRDAQRGLIFLANADGVWILQQSLALDPEMLKAWLRQVSAP